MFVLGVVAVASQALLAHAQSPTPHVADGFSVRFKMAKRGGVKFATGAWFYDRGGRRQRHVFDLTFTFKEDQSARYDVLALVRDGFNHNVTVGVGDDAVCRPSEDPYRDPFDGISQGSWGGRLTFGGDECDVWHYNSTDGQVQNTICLAEDGCPRMFNTTLDPVFGISQHAFPWVSAFTYDVIAVGVPTEDSFEASTACAQRYPTPNCPQRGIDTLDLYRIHSEAEPAELGNRDIGDALGDLAFLCEAEAAKTFHDRLVTHWKVSTNSSYGQYQYCFFVGGSQGNVCLGNSSHMGRESAWGLGQGHLQGQCSDNRDVGSWFSIPAAGECRPGEAIGTNGCTWGGATALRTVSAQCILEDRGLLAACREEQGKLPFVKSKAILEAALASDDPTRGGCPDVSRPALVI